MKLSTTIERIASLASLLDDHLQEKLWEYAELLYVEQVAFGDDTEEADRALQTYGEWITFDSIAQQTPPGGYPRELDNTISE